MSDFTTTGATKSHQPKNPRELKTAPRMNMKPIRVNPFEDRVVVIRGIGDPGGSGWLTPTACVIVEECTLYGIKGLLVRDAVGVGEVIQDVPSGWPPGLQFFPQGAIGSISLYLGFGWLSTWPPPPEGHDAEVVTWGT
jgi:hypothetical protein